MTVLTPLFLVGLAALAIPILLHLLRRRERRTLVFPALRYLKRTTQEHARIVRLRQLLLLALRLAAVSLIALAGARLVLPLGGSDDPPAGLAIVVDNGLTSATVVGEGRVLDSLTFRALQALDRTGPRDQVWVVPAGSPSQPAIPLSPEQARREIEFLNPTHVTPSLYSVLGRAGALLEAAAPNLRETVIVSDLRPEALEPVRPGESGARVRSDRVVIAPAPAPPPPNRGIGGLLVSGGLTPRAGELGEIEVTIVGADVGGSTVRGYVDGRLIGTVSAALDGTAVLPLPPLPAGWIRGRVEVEPDGLRGDDVLYFAFRAIPPPVVQVLGPIAPFLDEALSVLDEAGRVQLIQDGLATVQVMSTGSTDRPSPDATVIVVPPNEEALLTSLNQELNQLQSGWRLEAAPSGAGSGVELLLDGGLLIDFLPSRATVRRAYTIQPDSPEAQFSELLSLSDGRPWVVESVSSGRSVIVVASPMTIEATDLPASASMLPLVELLTSRSVDSMAETRVHAGQPFSFPDGAASVGLPDGTRRALLGQGAFHETELAGIYEILDADDQILSLVAVNPISPASAQGVTAAEAASRLRAGWSEVTAGEPWPQSVLLDRRGREVAQPLLMALLLLLFGECWLASVDRQSVRQSEEHQAGGAGAGGRNAIRV